jgi:NADPH-dependent 2,4-dienoyl-CoA reductase/sulfur reductase-like enzyme/nitrite reductase/ring-hydroxylating ferredoxin subunit
MSAEQPAVAGPDFSEGVKLSDIPDGGMLGGHVGDKPVLLSRRGDEVSAISGQCTHYGGPLAEGLVVGNTVRCPWHHACFDLRTGEATCAPALNHVSTWNVEVDGKRVKVTTENPPADPLDLPGPQVPIDPALKTIVIVGAGAAGNAAAEMLRRQGYTAAIIMITAEDAVPYDRPNLSKDYLAGNAPEEWIPLRPEEFYSQHGIELVKNARVSSINAEARVVSLSTGRTISYNRLLLATGAEPIRPSMPGAELEHVHYLRSLADSRKIIKAADDCRIAVVIGASFIGLEVAASLRTRGLQVDVVSPESTPLEKVLGKEVGAFIKAKHEKEGVTFHLGRSATGITKDSVRLDNGNSLPAEMVVIGIGVRPLLDLAVTAGAEMSRGVAVNEFLETSLAGIFAAGDIARYPDPRSGADVRIEHWVVAERQGQTAAKNMLGMKQPFTSVPFFWSNHYDVAIGYVGHAEGWDKISVAGKIADGNAVIGYKSKKKTLAVAAINQSLPLLHAEVALEKEDWKRLDKLTERKR